MQHLFVMAAAFCSDKVGSSFGKLADAGGKLRMSGFKTAYALSNERVSHHGSDRNNNDILKREQHGVTRCCTLRNAQKVGELH